MTEQQAWPPKALHEKVAAVQLAGAGYYREAGARETAVRAAYGRALPSMTRFWQVILTLLDDVSVIEQAPAEVRRLRELLPSPQRQAQRAAARRAVRARVAREVAW